MKFLVQQQPAYTYTAGKAFEAKQPSIVFIHGAANDHSVWGLQSRYFAHHGWNALALDLPGHGRSFAPAKTSISQYVDWLIHFLDAGAIDKATLIGHSMGSLIALDVAARYPQRIARLALLGASAPMPVADSLLETARNRPVDAIDMVNIWGHAPQMKWRAAPSPGTCLLMANKRLLEKSAPGVLAGDLAACNEFKIDGAQLAAIKTPTLIISGSHDMMTPPKTQTALAAQIGSARLCSIEGSGHALMQEAPDKVLDALRDFLQP